MGGLEGMLGHVTCPHHLHQRSGGGGQGGTINLRAVA